MSQGTPDGGFGWGTGWPEGARRRRAECGGGGARRWRCSDRGMAVRGGGLASRGQGEANQGVVEVGVGRWRWVHGGQGSPELEKSAAVRVAGDRDRPGLFIGPE